MRKTILLILAAAFCLTAEAQSQSFGVLEGRVKDAETGRPLAGANVFDMTDSTGTAAGNDGEFSIRLMFGAHRIRVSHVGYESKDFTVEIRPGETTRIGAALVPAPLRTEDVIVEEEIPEMKYVPQEITLSRRIITELPTPAPDVYQSIKKLPGVYTVSDKSAEFNVRGSHFDEHLTTVGGVPVARPFHLKAGSYESISIFNPELIESVEFYPGNFPVWYGWKMSSAMDLKYRQGSRDTFTYTASVNTFLSNIVLEGPLKKSGSWIVGIRKSYLDYWFDRVRPFENGQGDFFDVQGRIRLDLSPRLWLDLVSIIGSSGYDYTPQNWEYILKSSPRIKISNIINGEETNRFSTYMQTVKASYSVSDNTLITLTGAYYRESDDEDAFFYKTSSYSSKISGQNDSGYYERYEQNDNRLDYDRVYVRGEFDHAFGESVTLTAGAETMWNDAGVSTKRTISMWRSDSTSSSSDTNFDLDLTQRMHAVYAGLTLSPAPDVYVYPGVRMQYDDLTGQTKLNTSVSFSARLNETDKLYGGVGMYHQPPSYVEFMSASAVAPWITLRNQRSVQGSVGLHRPRTGGGHYKVEAFCKYSPNILPYIYEDGRYYYEFMKKGKALTYGLDFSLSGSMTENVHGVVSYGYLHAREKVAGEYEYWIPRSTDRPHTLNLGLIHTVNPESNIKFIFNFTFGIGYPFTPKHLETNSWGETLLVSEAKNRSRYKPYRRLDIRWSRDLNGLRFRNVELNGNVYLEIVNIWDIRNTLKYDYEYFGLDAIKKIPVFLTPRIYGGGFRFVF